jgi:hypothetical protein
MFLKLTTNLDGVKLYTSLYNIDGTQSSMGDGTTDTSSCSTLKVVHKVICLIFHRRGSEKYGSGSHDAI